MEKPIQQTDLPRQNQTQDPARYRVMLGWFVIPLCLLSIYALLKSISPSFTWEQIMDLLHVEDKERYSMLALWCLTLIILTALWRIFRK